MQNTMEKAIKLHQSGELGQAKALYQSILNKKPDEPNANHLMGALLIQEEKPRSAITYIEKALNQDHNAQFLNSLGMAYLTLKEYDEAIKLFKKAIEIDSKYPEGLYNLAFCYHQTKAHHLAEKYYRFTIDHKNDYLKAYINLSLILSQTDRVQEAIDLLNIVLILNNTCIDAYINLANIYHNRQQTAEAIEILIKANTIQPQHPIVLNNLSNLYLALEDISNAMSYARKALSCQADDPIALTHLANALARNHQYSEAIELYQQALAIHPDNPKTLHNLALTYVETKHITDAISLYQKALSQDKNPNIEWDLSLALLKQAHFSEGFFHYQAYWYKTPLPKELKRNHCTQWQGEPLTNKTLLLWGEQGIGDEIFFARIIPILTRMTNALTVECEPRLHDILQKNFPKTNFIKRSPEQKLNEFDYQSNLSWACHILYQQNLMPNTWAPYITVPQHTKKPIFSNSRRLKIGFAWQSGNQRNGLTRSLALDAWQPLLQTPKCDFISLQYGEHETELQHLENLIHKPIIRMPCNPLTDMNGFFYVVNECDLVISIDNTTVHTAGAIGKPVWVLLPYSADWRWGVEGSKTAWYPSMRLFRQKTPGNWNTLLAEIQQILSQSVSDEEKCFDQ